MSIKQLNSFYGSQPSNLRTTFRMNAGEEYLSLNKLIEQCSKLGVTIIQLPDKRLEAGLNVLPLKAKLKEGQQTIAIFITRFTEKTITVTGYYEGKKIEMVSATTEESIARLVKKWIESKKSLDQDHQKQSLTMVQKLNQKCNDLAKQQKSELVAIQKLKSTKEYISLIQHQIQLSMQIQSLAQLLTNLEKQIQNKNDVLLQKMIAIQTLKNQIEEYQYEYDQIGRCFRNVKEQITEYLGKQQEKVEKMEINSQAELNKFLVEAKLLKKLELQKRFLL